jgi:hypothetical protein
MSRDLVAAVVLALLSATGCEDERVGVRLVVTSDIDIPAALDEIVVTVVAADTDPERPLCAPWTYSLAPASADLPFELLVEPGTRYRQWLGFRIEGRLHGARVLFREMVVAWPGEGVLDVTVALEAACVGVAETCRPRDEECIAGYCVGRQSPGLFEDAAALAPPDAPPCFDVIE